MTRTMRVISACTHTRSLFAASNSLLKGCSKAVSHVKSGLFGNFNKTRGAGDIDFSQVIANHIKSNQQQSTPGQTRSDGFGDFNIACRQGLGNTTPARSQIAAGFAGQRNTRQCVRNRLAAYQQNTLVALDDFRNVALSHDGARTVVGERFEDGAQVGLFGTQAENASTPHAVQRLDDDIVVLGMKST